MNHSRQKLDEMLVFPRHPLLVDALDLMAAWDAIDVAMPQVQGEDWDKRLCAALDLHLSPRTSPPGPLFAIAGDGSFRMTAMKPLGRGSLKYLLFFLFFAAASAHADLLGRVVAVTDGDTLKVLDEDRMQHTVRLTGIDAPERGQSFSTASRDHLAGMVAGKEVRVDSSKNDRSGRVLGKVWVQPSDCRTCGKILDANYAQVLAGMAWWYRYYAKGQSPEDRGRYESAEDEAKARGWGFVG